MQECTRSLKGQYRIKGPVARIADGAIFGPTVLQLSKLPGADRSSRRRSSLDIHLFVPRFSHAELTVQTSLRDAKEMIGWLLSIMMWTTVPFTSRFARAPVQILEKPASGRHRGNR